MIKFRQKEYSSIGTKFLYKIENLKQGFKAKEIKRLKNISSEGSNADQITKRAARIKLNREEYKKPKSDVDIKRSAISAKKEIKSTLKSPEKLIGGLGKATDSAIKFSIKHPKPIIGGISGVAIPAGVAMINPIAGVVTATLPIGTAVNLAPIPKTTRKKLKVVSRKYNNTQFSKRLRGVRK